MRWYETHGNAPARRASKSDGEIPCQTAETPLDPEKIANEAIRGYKQELLTLINALIEETREAIRDVQDEADPNREAHLCYLDGRRIALIEVRGEVEGDD